VSDVERIAQTYSHTLRSDLIAELNRLRAKERALLAALDEANTDRQRLAKDNERISEAWRQGVLRQQRSDNAHDYDMQQLEAERDEALRMLRVRDTTVANLQSGLAFERAARERVEALADKWDAMGMIPVYESPLELSEILRAALSGDG
jgi:hypothetical protein